MPENISMEEFLSLTPNVEEEKENKENTISKEEFLSLGKTNGSADATSTGGPNVMEFGSDDGSLVYIKPKNDEEAISSVKNIRKGINENTPEVIGSIAKEYFNLDNFERFRKDNKTSPGNFTPSKLRGTVFHPLAGLQEKYRGEDFFRNTEDEDLKRFFESTTTKGDFTKYEQYKEYQETGAFNLDWVDESTKSNAVNYRKKQKTQQYIADIDDDDVRESAEIAAEEGVLDIFEPNEDYLVYKYSKLLKEDRKLKKQYDDDVNKFGIHNRHAKGVKSKSEKFLIDYLEKKRKGLERDSFNFENSFKRFEGIRNKSEGELINLQKEFDALGDVGEYSSAEEIAKYNALAAKQNAIIEKFNEETKGLNILERQTDLLSRIDKHETAISTVTEADEIAKAFGLNYNIGERTLLHLEKAIVGDMAGLGFGTLAAIGGVSEKIGAALGDEETNEPIIKYFKNKYAAHLNYKESLNNHMESTLPLNIEWKDVSSNNIGEVSGQLLANNSFSILSALVYGGAVARVTKVGTATAGYTVPQATKMLTGTFFAVEGGAKLSEMEIAQKNAKKNILALESALPFALTQDERLEILNQIDAQDKALNVTQIEKAFSTVLYGGIAAYAERLGTMGYVRRLNTMLKAASRPSIRNAIKGTGAFAFNSGIEYVEEFVTQVGHNLTDVAVLDQNKSLIAGIDAEFNMNVLFSTMAIQSPSVGKNIYNSIANEVKSTKEIAKDRQRRDEILEWKAILDRDNKLPKGKRNLSTERRDAIQAKIAGLLKEAGIADSYRFANVAQMTRSEIDALFEKQAKKRDELAAIRDLGAIGAGETEESNRAKRERKALVGNINQLDNEMDELLLKPEERNDKTVEEILGKENVEAETNFYFGKYQAAKQIAKGLGNVVEFKDDIVDGKRVEGSGMVKVETYLNEQLKNRNITLQQKNDYLEGFKKGNYASFRGNDVLLMEDNIVNGINNATSNLMKSVIAYAPFHELQHINDVATGLLKDGDIIESQKTVVKGIEDHLEILYTRGKINDKDYSFIKQRIASYTDKGGVDLTELLTIAGELKDAGVLNQESIDPLLSLKFLLNKFIRRNFGDNEMFFKLKNTEQVLQYIDSFQRSAKRSRLMLGPEEETKEVNFSQIYQEVEAMYNEEAWADPKKRSDLALSMAYALIPEVTRRMQSVNLDDYIKEDIAVDFATSDQRGLFGLIKNYDKEVNDSVMGYLNSFVTTSKGRFKLFDLRLQEFYQGDPRYGEIIQSMEQEGVGIRVAKLTDETNLEKALEDDAKKPKINVLKVGKTAAKEQDIIKAVNTKGDFRDVIDNNTGKIGNIIFNIPAKKIEDPTANIATSDKIINPETNKPVKKGEIGIPERSEATNIQDHFADINTTKDFIRLLNLTNVTEKDADINKVGENIEVSRDVLGRAIGLPRRILDYFYRPKFKADGKRVRSQGKTSQVPIWELKPEFKNLTDKQLTKVAEQFQKDLGITGKQQINKLPTKANRSKIGQLLKGAAVVVSQQASLSAAQRKLEKAKAPKQKIADITAAQPKVAFSKGMEGFMRDLFAIEEGKVVDKLLKFHKVNATFDLKTEKGIKDFIVALEGTKDMPGLLSLMPRDFWFGKPDKNGNFGTAFTPSYYVIGKSDNPVLKQKYKDLYNNIYVPGIKKLRDKKGVTFGNDFKDSKGNVIDFSISSYSTIFKNPEVIRKNIKNREIEKWNKKVALIHKEMWSRFNKAINSNRKNASVIGNYLKIVGNDTNHWHKLGAQFVGYSKKLTLTKAGKLKVEYEHAMPATAAYLYLMDSILGDTDFKSSYELVIDNYKLIYLDKAMDEKLIAAGLRTSMPKDWSVIDNVWWERYFNEMVASIEPSSIVGLEGRTFEEMFNINKEGKMPGMKTGINKTKKLEKAIVQSRKTVKASKGITILDFDDTLATTKSLVKYTRPDGTTGTLNAEEYASTYEDLLDQGFTFDFSDFNKVVKGKLAPLFQKALKLQNKFGPENMFILTARPPAAQKAIFDFLKANGLNIPIKNITGLGNSTAEAKALWIADKVGEGYNDFYFADDALQNVQAVKNMLDQFDVKSKVQQAKLEKHGKFLIDTSTKEGQKLINQIKNIPTVSSSEFKKVGKWNIDTKTKEGQKIVDELNSIKTISSSEFEKVGHWTIDLTTPEGKKIQQELKNIKTVSSNIKFSKGMNDQFNDILENVTGIEAKKRFSAIKGRKRGESKGKFRFFIPPSHEDFVGLLYNFLGKGKEGNAHRDFFEQALIRPLNRANREYDTARQSVANDYKALNKQFVDVRKKLTKKTPDGDFTFQDAIRVYLWDKHGHSIPGLSPTDQQNLVDLVVQDSELQSYAETLNVISKQDTYVNPTEGWNSGDIRMDLDDATGRIGRQQFFAEFIENADIIFSEENLNKIEAGYGNGVRSSLEDMLYRIKTGRNRPTGQNAQVNKLMNYLNGSVGTVMFFNMRSALLQQMSLVNYINFADNNIFAAAKAFANQKQYWADWAFIFNSDMLKQRRGGIQTDVNGAELAASLRNSKDITRKLISKLLELGFLPTQIGDNIAIATGGAPFYRNRINTYLKQGLSKKEAEAKAFDDFQATTQSTQQSARPDMVSKQQASVIGKVILNFQNVTSQFNRLGKKAFQDIYNRRITKPNATQMQSDISNAARITYYFAIQNAIFYTLQTALFAMMFDDDEEDDNKLFLKKKERLINGSIDSVLRGSGLVGGVVATLKNVAIAFARQRDVKYNPDESAVALEALNLSPVLGIKVRKIVNAEKTLNYNKKVIDEMSMLDIDNPQWSAVTNYTEAITNVPLNRLYNKTQNVRQALNNEHSAWERSLMFLGWSQYNLNLENKKMEDIKEKVKGKKKNKGFGGKTFKKKTFKRKTFN